MRLVCISDTHLQHDFKVPDGDVLIHAGDLTVMGTEVQVAKAGEWLRGLPHPNKVIIAGNHDFLFQEKREKAVELLTKGLPSMTYLEDSYVTIGGVSFYGTPWVPKYMDWAFMKPDQDLQDIYEKLPGDLDVLITHGPPLGLMDEAGHFGHVGSQSLRRRLKNMEWEGDCAPRVHVFGHIHAGHGLHMGTRTLSINAAICDEFYEPSRGAIVVDI